LPLYLAFLAGSVLTHNWVRVQALDCRFHLPEGKPLQVRGRLRGLVVGGRGELRPGDDSLLGCREPIRIVIKEGAVRQAPAGGDATIPGEPRQEIYPAAGATLQAWGRWRESGGGFSPSPRYAGYLLVDSLYTIPGRRGGGGERGVGGGGAALRDVMDRLGAGVQNRLGELFPAERGLATALIWARKDGLDPTVKEAFARAGTAHLLAISGFHVGVVAGLLLLLAGGLGLAHPLRFLLASSGVWLYVLAIGLPDAALRAALILTVLALGRLRGRSVVSLGALATAFLLFLVLDPGALLRPGFQLSFAGAVGLVLGSRGLSRRLSSMGRFSLPLPVAGGIAAGVTATLATLPLVAWHFGRVSVVGIPMTLLAAPLVALAIPGIFASLLLSLLHTGLGHFLATGVEWDLQLLASLVRGGAGLPFASVWVSRPSVLAGVLGGALGLLTLLAWPRWAGRRRGLLPGWTALAALLLGPLVAGTLNRGTMELVVLDVGQGDALVLRSPEGRWILVDAGPRTESYDAGARTVLPYLRQRGVPELELLVLTHPDMDHVGGAPAILLDFPVAGVMDPGAAVGKEVFLDALHAARARGVPWVIVGAGDSLNLDGIALRVLAPDSAGRAMASEDANAASLVLELRYGAFSALLTGDAPSAVEETALRRLLSPRIHVLKIGHHGSSTSTGADLLERTHPETALISVGRRNRYGHPHSSVLQRLEAAGVRIFRTDEDGMVVVRARKDGSYRVRGRLTGK